MLSSRKYIYIFFTFSLGGWNVYGCYTRGEKPSKVKRSHAVKSAQGDFISTRGKMLLVVGSRQKGMYIIVANSHKALNAFCNLEQQI